MNWTEFHFFKQPGGLSKNDALEMLICLDYEQALECSRLVDFVQALSQDQREEMLKRAVRYRLSPFVPLEAGPEPPIGLKGLSFPPFRDWEAAALFPAIPAVCIAVSWFPKHWLEAPVSARRNVVDKVRKLYPIERLPIFPFPPDPDKAVLLIVSAEADSHTTLHVIAIDRTQTKSAFVRRFKSWLDQQEFKGTASRKGKVNVPARLDDLACYRLSLLGAVMWETAMAETGFRRSVARLSAAKRRSLRRLQALRYI